MQIIGKIEIINNKKIPIRIVGNEKSKYVYLLNHGLLSKKESFIPLERIGKDQYLFVSFDARGNEGSTLKASRYSSTYVNDLRDVTLWLKKKYPNKKIILAGSSWGAAVVIKFSKKYGQLVDKVIAWSIPHKIMGSDDTTHALNNANNTKDDTSSLLHIIFAFFLMFISNVNTYIKLKIQYERTTKNKMLVRMGKLKKFNIARTRYIWSVWKTLISSIRAFKFLNKKSKVEILYIQSSHDTYGRKKTFDFLKQNTGDKVKYLLVNEFFHAFQWETTNVLNVRIFNTLTNWINTGIVKWKGPQKVATHTNKKLSFSFIIPIYNVEQYIEECVDSILQNSTTDYEIILVNDNSTDDSSKILSKYKSVKNVRIINHKLNKGLSATRNTGIEHAVGEWYIFVDSDDYISPNFTRKIKTHLDNSHNLYIYNIIKDKKAYKIDKKVQKYKANDSLVSNVINNSVFNKYRFPEKYRYGVEDWDFYVHEWTNLTIKNICYDNEIWYYYRYNPNSLSKAKCVYRSRLLHAIKIYDESETRQVALTYKLYGHYYIELLMLSRIWFPDLLPKLKEIKYHQKVRFITKVASWITRIWFIKNMARKSRKRIDE